MPKTIINIKTEIEIKKNVQDLAEELGITLSDVVNASLRNFLRTREVRFSSIPEMTLEFEKFLGSADKDIRNRKNLSPVLKDKKSVDEYLDSL